MSEPREIEVEGRNVQEAVFKGLAELGRRREQVDVKVLSEGSSGLFGLMGSTPARIRLTVTDDTPPPPPAQPVSEPRRHAPSRDGERGERGRSGPRSRPEGRGPRRDGGGRGDGRRGPRPDRPPRPRIERPRSDEPPVDVDWPQAEERVKQALQTTLNAMEFEVESAVRVEDGRVLADLSGPDAVRLLEQDAQPLEALQLLVAARAARDPKTRVPVVLDAAGFRARQKELVVQKALKAAADVKAGGQPVSLEPMNSSDRRTAHQALKDDPAVETRSDGLGSSRRVVIHPKAV